MVYFIEIQPTEHYIEEHEQAVPWDKVIEIIFRTKKSKKERK
ncbi:MAG: hypothetical protein UV40_C0007G0019 [Parcubacteria group bacterium GW2011_GWA1_42_7]|nr:MAG: hypothetical protein UV40_C0007G0019 [Parcubacteria group bacterium GW2011_GWA1_42_7]